ncbi:pyridoxal phosphate-dependent aminotransferase [Pseudoroseicyclus tamaricis]|uniref:Pyridoxal phosphate-dependent aminotransferase n=1 Tax=Pseudoroseicyclus tamaricis TaxID=2705421 RepID=A0A6B2JTM4_9RHOB|nr:pyridoxal phosphate-dependent aminotransferase [Pseudoroseicyclus tamaricis]NDV01400.1 pyridoxal phosphate-dependent aminotransferase [Pseudoroseicyclus tamaricis]
MSDDPRLAPLAASLPATVPFTGPEALERLRGRPFRARLGANESVFGPSPKAIAAMEAAAREIWKYGDSASHDLRHALAAHHGVAPENIVVGAGIDGLLGSTVRLFLAPGEVAVSSLGSYPTFDFHVSGHGGRAEKVPFRDDREDPEALLGKAEEVGAKLIYLSNPDNPMGSWHSGAEVARMVARVPEGALLILDEAYVEFAPDGTAAEVDVEDPKVLRFRTFSKAHGMAGARVGYALGPRHMIRVFEKVRDHFGMSRTSQSGALAALQDELWLTHVRGEVAAARERIAAIAAENGLGALPSATNFVTVDCGGDGALAKAVLEELAARDIFVRMPFAAPQNRCIRITAGRPEEMDLLATLLPEALAAARARG